MTTKTESKTETSDTTLASSRRDFLRGGLTLGAGLAVGLQWSHDPLSAATKGAEDFVAGAFVRIAPDNTVTVISKHIEFGQGSYTGLATILAEELDADWSQIRVEAAPAEVPKYANTLLGAQGTGGSTAMANSWPQMRQAGAKARAMLVAAAAQAWNVPAAQISVSKGVVKAGNHQASFGELAERAATLSEPESVTLKDPKNFTLIGKDVPRVDVPDKARGKATFTIDVQRPGMLTAVLARPPLFGATVSRVDDAEAKKVNGVVDVVQVPRGVAVVAKNFWAAEKGRKALKIDWDESQAETRGSDELTAEFRAMVEKPGVSAASRGDAAKGLAGATKVVEAEFEFPYLAHAPMEPLDAVVELSEDGCDVWAGSQIQTMDHMVVAATVGLPPEKVRIHTMLAGGSFGRRATPDSDVAGEAASIAKAISGKAPVKLIWTREDDIRGGRYRPSALHRLKAGLNEKGELVAWHHRLVTQSIMQGTPFEAVLVQNGIDGTSVEGARGLPYAIPNFEVELHTPDVGVPVLWWRSVGHTHNGYATEVFFDDVARAAGKDPVAMRLGMLAKHPRHRQVLEMAAEKAGWGGPLPEGRARGVALQESFQSFVAQVVEVSVDKRGLPKVHRVVCVVDCGVAINPDVIRAQMESGIGYGLGAVMYNEITLDKGRVVPSNFHDYRPLRLPEMPEVEVHIVPSGEAPSGVGEPGVPPIGPAVANAFFELTGKHLRRLPFVKELAPEEGFWQ
jgi:isoquinoline 1-oxidoreductase beta subunit